MRGKRAKQLRRVAAQRGGSENKYVAEKHLVFRRVPVLRDGMLKFESQQVERYTIRSVGQRALYQAMKKYWKKDKYVPGA